MTRVAIIGCGASGMTAAIAAAGQGAEVFVLEHNAVPGKKILMTGNGKCNLTNTVQKPEFYRSGSGGRNAGAAQPASDENIAHDVHEVCVQTDGAPGKGQSADPRQILQKYTEKDIIRFFEEIGVPVKEKNGFVYPYSERASAVRDALVMEMKRLNIIVYTNTKCESVSLLPDQTEKEQDSGKRREPGKRQNPGNIQNPRNIRNPEGCFMIHASTENREVEFYADRVIVCTGSKAAPSSGSDGSGYCLAEALGHTVEPVLPALVPLKCAGKHWRKISGVRCRGKISLYMYSQIFDQDGRRAKERVLFRNGHHEKNEVLFPDGDFSPNRTREHLGRDVADRQEKILLASDTGELQFTDSGISGIPVFQVSRYASRALYEGKKTEALLDFLPEYSLEEVRQMLKSRAGLRPEKTAEQFLIGLFHEKLSALWLSFAKIPKAKRAGDFTDEDFLRLSRLIKEFRAEITEPDSFARAQVCCGGVRLSEVHPETLESRLVPGLYFAGEILDVDGICGGYNLTWAFSGGHLAGISAAAKMSEA